MTDLEQKPRLRFKGFTEAWEQRKLKDESNYIVAGGDVDKSKLKESGSYPVIANALTNDGIVGYYASEFRIDAPAVTVTGRGEVGYAVARKCNFTPIVRLLSIKTSHDVDFLANNINLKGFVVESTGVPQLTVPKLEDLLLYFPKQISEEIHIGNMFVKINDLITLHQRKYEKLKSMKAALLEKIFPSENETTPKIRFKGFTEAWEQRKYGDIAELFRGLTYSPSNIVEHGTRVLRSSNINEDYFVKSDDDVFVEDGCININYAKDRDILITSANGSSRLVGKHAVLDNIFNEKVVHGGFMLLAKTKNPYFLNASMSSTWYKKFIDLYIAGGNGAIGNLSKSDLDNYEFLVPHNEEQLKIGELFKNLDAIITLHQRKCEKLKNLKKSLLERMFI